MSELAGVKESESCCCCCGKAEMVVKDAALNWLAALLPGIPDLVFRWVPGACPCAVRSAAALLS